jgi:oligopeptidase B
MLEGMTFFADYYVLVEREGGLPQLRVTDFKTNQAHRIAFPSRCTTRSRARTPSTAARRTAIPINR